LFHKVCETLVSPIGADPDNEAFVQTFNTLYRQPDHTFLEKRCKEAKDKGFSPGVVSFANQIVALKNKRMRADYDPLAKFAISSVKTDVETVRDVMEKFDAADVVEQVRFAYFVSLKPAR